MTRNQFLGVIITPVALLFRRKEVEPNPVIKNSRFKELKKIQARLDFLRKYPLTEREVFRPYGLELPDFRKKLIDQIPKFYGRKMKQFTN